MKFFRRADGGFTILELVVVVLLVGVLSSAFVSLVVPSIDFLLYFPHSSRVDKAASDLMQVIMEGDDKAQGLRFTGPECKIGGAGGGGSGITEASTSAGVSVLTYNYVTADECGSTASRMSHSVTLTFDSSAGTVTRSIDGGPAHYIPDYIDGSSDIRFEAPGGGADLFHYFSTAGADLGTDPLTVGAISYVKNISSNQSKTAGTSLAVSVPLSGVSAGNLVIVSFAIDGVTGTLSVSDSQGNSYSLAANGEYASPGTGNVRTAVFYSTLTTALVSGNSITVSHPSATARAMSADEFSNVNGVDVTAIATGSGTSQSTGSMSTTLADELLWAVFGVEGDTSQTFTSTSGFLSIPPPRAGTTGGSANTNITVNPLYKIVSATGNYSSTGTLSTNTDCAKALVGFANLGMGRIDVDVIALPRSGLGGIGMGQIRMKSGVQIKRYKKG